MTKTKHPTQIYVTAQMRKDSDFIGGEWVYGDEYALAFLHPHEPNKKADAKRKQTQLEWAYGSYRGSYEVVNGIIIQNSVEYVNYKQQTKRCPAEYQPRVFDNDPLSGFEIFEVETRYSTNNKLFRVKDPRGFVAEITAKSLLGIILDGTITNGIIQGECVWHANKNLVLHKKN